jgi:[acyl-carrier-protein] S-malonyltransferase
MYITSGLPQLAGQTTGGLNRYRHAVRSEQAKSAWVFAGQGSQFPGMGQDLWALPGAKARLAKAERILGWSVAECCNDEAKLKNTQYCQPCLFVVSSLLTDLLKAHGYRPDFVAGYSLGEYCALYTARVFDFESGLYLIKRRAEIMANAPSGIMVALLGCDRRALAQQVQANADVEIISDEQSRKVIAGTRSAVKCVIAKVKADRIVPMNVGKAFHTRFMQASEQEYQSILDEMQFSTATVPVLSNTDPVPTVNAGILKRRLRQHMTALVLWDATVLRLTMEMVKTLIEVGPSKTLTRNLRQASRSFDLQNVSSLNDLEKHADTAIDAMKSKRTCRGDG